MCVAKRQPQVDLNSHQRAFQLLFLPKGFGTSCDLGQGSLKASEQVGPLWKRNFLLLCV